MLVSAVILDDSAFRRPFEQDLFKMASYKVCFSVFGFLFAALMVSRRPSHRHRQWLLGFRLSALG
ncbi:hypothetical protein HanRHA438_Chr14g0664211 [Helianthus annuus]|uniref:Uncharacterized protein n=1 Tax=Helianthus annuus TaxID=4232 RepID=A0A9K3H7G9_HELAN|nr:hypothetical protein HanXRQr2_Chr14g0653491 [Helianthus annuus]KAJ0464856.1 hypothetical protein HanHA300_Chr14g0531931 [Helianthus annuus]KAJ0469542.1 hypothetical protein HanIR_Chr14g0709001 [Helianthus annuus]KAJ0486447.1 hypothetical protein HanHA89_Chr14g0579731 [Helianthus annuus]KAJ0657012.1 hypothetical protein HanLR1_Chr14g0542291 [Helianthus annuus]